METSESKTGINEAESSINVNNFDEPSLVVNDVETETQNDEIPEEMKTVEVDLDDPRMDPLEWSVRKTLPIPKVYYWETGNENIPRKTKLWHHSVNVLSNALKVAEKAGGVIADVAGFNSTQYDYVTATMTDEQWEQARKTMLQRNVQRQNSFIERKNKKEEAEAMNDAGAASDVIL